jgi:predicted Rossmann-fold nucleotide-binding protein
VAAIGVFCASSRRLDQRWLDLAHDVGVELARRGHILVSGGGRVGMMGAVAEGARSGGTHTVGVIPQLLVGLMAMLIVAGDISAALDALERVPPPAASVTPA